MTRSIFLISIARTVSLALGVILLALLGRRLGTSGFGTLQLALAVMAYPLVLVDLGLTTFGLRAIAKGNVAPDLVQGVVAARLILAAAALIALGAAVIFLPLNPLTRTLVVVLGLGLPASALNARWVLQGERRFGRVAVIDAASTGAQLLAVLILVRGEDDAPAAAVALTIAAWATTTISARLAGRWSRLRPDNLPRRAHRTITPAGLSLDLLRLRA